MDKEYFNSRAAGWDDNPVRMQLALAVGEAILKSVPVKATWSVLDYGCGTASVSALLSEKVLRIVAADSSEGMLEQVRRKISDNGFSNIEPVQMDLETQNPPEDKFDLIFSSMAFHHIKDTERLVRMLSGMLAPGGWMAIADLLKEDGSFHSEVKVPHDGFDTDILAGLLESSGLRKETCEIAHTIERNGRRYPIFLMTAKTDK